MFVVIAPAGLAVALQKRIPTNGRIVLFRDTDALAAWNTIMTRQPTVIALDPRFVNTSRGAALIARARAEPSLSAASFRVLTLDDDEQTVRLLQDCHDAPEAAILSVSRPLDRCGSRAAPRFPIVAGARALVNGEPIQVVDLDQRHSSGVADPLAPRGGIPADTHPRRQTCTDGCALSRPGPRFNPSGPGSRIAPVRSLWASIPKSSLPTARARI